MTRRKLTGPLYVLTLSFAALPLILVLPRITTVSPLVAIAIYGLPIVGAAFLLMAILLISPNLLANDESLIPDLITVPTLHLIALCVSATFLTSAKNSILALPDALVTMGEWRRPAVLAILLGVDVAMVFAVSRLTLSKIR